MEVKQGSFAANTSTGNQAITGVGFTPKVVIFMTEGLTAVGDAAGPANNLDPHFGFGWAAGVGKEATISQAFRSDTLDTAGIYGSALCLLIPKAAASPRDGYASLVSFDTDGFTINWVDAPSQAVLIQYMVIGGSDVQAHAGTTTVRTTLGDASITGAGFTPKAALFIANGASTNPSGTGVVGLDTLAFGMATSPTERGSISMRASDSVSPSSEVVIQMQRALCTIEPSLAQLDWHFDLKTFDADGFSYTVTKAPLSGVSDYFSYLLIGGDELLAKVDSDTQKTSTGTKSKTGIGFVPKGLLAISRQGATGFETAEVSTQANQLVMGMRDATSESCLWHSIADNVTVSDTDRSHSQSKFIQFRDQSRAVLAEADVASLDGDGFTLDWTTADGTGRHFIVLALGQITNALMTASAVATGGAQAGDMNWGEKRSDAVSSGGQSPFVGVLNGPSDAISTASVLGVDILLTALSDARLDVDARLAMPTATAEAEAGDGASNVATMYLLHGTSLAGHYPFHLQPVAGFYILSSPPALGVLGEPALGLGEALGNANMFFAHSAGVSEAELAHFSLLGESNSYLDVDPGRIAFAGSSDGLGGAAGSLISATIMTASSGAVSSASIMEVIFGAPDVSAPRIYRRIIVPLYEFWLCESPDPRTPLVPLEKIASLDDATQRNFTIVKNRPGSISFRVPLEGPSAEQIYRRQDNRGTVRSAVKVRRKGRDGFWRTMHSGPIWTIQGDAEGDNLVVNCVGWQATTANRRLREEPTSVFNAPIDQIIFAVMDIINAQDPNGRDLLIDKGQVYGSPITIRIPLQKDQNLNQIMLQFSDVEGGVDLVIDPDTRKLDIYNWDQVLTKDVQLGYNWGPNNLANFTWAENTQQWVDYLEVIGGDKTRAVVTDEEAMDEFGVSDQVISRPEIIGTKALQTLLGYAGAEVAIRARPFLTYTIFPKKISPEDEHAIRLFDDFDVGDKIYWSARKGPIRVTKQQIRLFGASVNVDDEGNEDIQNMQITAESLG